MTDPTHNVAAFRAARDWAEAHGHQQPDDRMLKAYGRALVGEHHLPLLDLTADEVDALIYLVDAAKGSPYFARVLDKLTTTEETQP